MLHQIFYIMGIILLITGTALMDSSHVIVPVIVIIAGFAFLVLGAREEGNLKKGGRRE